MIEEARRIAIDAAWRRLYVTVVFLSLIAIRMLLMAVPAVFLISMTLLRLLFVVVPTTRLPRLVSLSFTVPLVPGGMLATPAANRRRRFARSVSTRRR